MRRIFHSLYSHHYLFLYQVILSDQASEEGSGFGASGYGLGTELSSWLGSGLGINLGSGAGSGEGTVAEVEETSTVPTKKGDFGFCFFMMTT